MSILITPARGIGLHRKMSEGKEGKETEITTHASGHEAGAPALSLTEVLAKRSGLAVTGVDTSKVLHPVNPQPNPSHAAPIFNTTRPAAAACYALSPHTRPYNAQPHEMLSPTPHAPYL